MGHIFGADSEDEMCLQLLTCSLTFAVSSGKVMRSAMQAAVPAPKNLTAAQGATSLGLMPTISTYRILTKMENICTFISNKIKQKSHQPARQNLTFDQLNTTATCLQ